MLCVVQIEPEKPVLDDADCTAPTRQHELYHTDRTDHTDQKCIYLSVLEDPDREAGNICRWNVRGVRRYWPMPSPNRNPTAVHVIIVLRGYRISSRCPSDTPPTSPVR